MVTKKIWEGQLLSNTWTCMFDSEHLLYLNNTGFERFTNLIKYYNTSKYKVWHG
jgi:hypothetical protein